MVNQLDPLGRNVSAFSRTKTLKSDIVKLFLPDRQRWHLRRRRKGEHENDKRTCEPRRKSEKSGKTDKVLKP